LPTKVAGADRARGEEHLHVDRIASMTELRIKELSGIANGLDRIIDEITRISMLSRPVRRWMAVALDGAMCVFSAWAAFCLRLGELYPFDRLVFIVAVTSLTTWFVVAWRCNVYRTIIRFAGSRTLLGLISAVAVHAIPMALVFMVAGVPHVPRTIGLLQPILFLAQLALSRLVISYLIIDLLGLRGARGTRLVVIYGAGRAGELLAQSIRHQVGLQLVGFVDDDPRLAGQKLNGVLIYPPHEFEELMRLRSINEVLLAMPGASMARRKQVIESLQPFNVHVRSLPSMGHIIDGKVAFTDLREVPVEDLLGRDPVQPNELLLGKTLLGKTVLVTGAGGSIGSELCRQIMRCSPARLVLLEQSEFALYSIQRELEHSAQTSGGVELVSELASVVDADAVGRILSRWSPDTVFHAAAYKHVPLVEANPLAGLKNNAFGTRNVVLAAEQCHARHFILVSTDKAVRPTNVMGASKRLCELIVQARAALQNKSNPRTVFSIVRFGNVLGSSGSVVPLFKEQIRAGGPVTLTHADVTRYFMTIPEASQLVIQAGALAKGGEVFVLDMGEPVRIGDLAESMIRLSGLTVRNQANPDGDIEICEIGLRPGEKLSEELLIGDNPEPTAHPRIMKAREVMISWMDLEPALARLGEMLKAGDAAGSLWCLGKIVVEFKSSDRRPSSVGSDRN
jgi:FlaA1/EpsC-like NDP-sugar epimerase